MSPLEALLAPLRETLAQAAQSVVDEWEQDEEGIDEELGAGGVCDQVADAMSEVISSALPDAEVESGGHDGDDHAFLVVTLHLEQVIVDVPPGVYEVGGGYRWWKIKGAVITPADVVIEEI